MGTATEPFVIVLYGKDARTDALAETLRRSSRNISLFAFSQFRIPGLLDRCDEGVWDGDLTASGLDAMVAFAEKHSPDLAVIGPEDPLAAGLVDRLEAIGIPCFGPRGDLARVEASKSWTRELVQRAGIAVNPEFAVFHSADGIAAYLAERPEFVVKPDGLTGGKGVRVYPEHFDSLDEAIEYAVSTATHSDRSCVVIEERFEGEEFSLMSITDGETVIHCPAVQDHKRAFAGDTGPNTGGMGTYSAADGSLPFLTADDIAAAHRTNEAVVRALRDATGQPYRGVLYGGFMATADGVKLIEYNCRFGDPEAMNVLPLFTGDFVDLALAVATGTLASATASFAPQASVCKYLVPAAYPAPGGKGDPVVVPADVAGDPDVRLYWAATNRDEATGGARMTGSRALGVVGVGATITEAEAHAERAAQAIEAASGGTVRHRADIGTEALIQRRIEHMRAIRG